MGWGGWRGVAPGQDDMEADEGGETAGGAAEEPDVLVWFWALLSSMSQAQQRSLLRFWTALPCLPAGGFGELPHQLAIVRADYTSQKYPQVGVPPGLPACPLTPAEFGLPSRQLGDVRTQQYT